MPKIKIIREKRKQTTIYMTETETAKIAVVASKERRSMAQMVVILALEALAARLERARAASLA